MLILPNQTFRTDSDASPTNLFGMVKWSGLIGPTDNLISLDNCLRELPFFVY